MEQPESSMHHHLHPMPELQQQRVAPRTAPRIPPRPKKQVATVANVVAETAVVPRCPDKKQKVIKMPLFINEKDLDAATESSECVLELRRNLEAELAVGSKQLPEVQLAYGRALCLAKNWASNRRGCELLEQLVEETGIKSEITSQAFFFLAVSRFRLGEYRQARILCEKYMRRTESPEDLESGRLLLTLIRRKVYQEGYSGYGVALLVVLSSALAFSSFSSFARRV